MKHSRVRRSEAEGYSGAVAYASAEQSCNRGT